MTGCKLSDEEYFNLSRNELLEHNAEEFEAWAADETLGDLGRKRCREMAEWLRDRLEWNRKVEEFCRHEIMERRGLA